MFQRKTFNVLQQLDNAVDIKNAMRTSHFANDRIERIIELPIELGDSVYSFVVDTGHPNGNEIHTINTDAIIFIQNERTQKLITFLFARPQQVRRYFQALDGCTPNTRVFHQIINNAYANEQLAKNLI